MPHRTIGMAIQPFILSLYELMQIAYAAVGKDFQDVAGSDDLIGSKYSKLQKLEMVPERWPLAQLSFSLQTCVDHLDRVLAGCCWEVQATRTTPLDSLTSLHEVAKCLTMKLAVYLAKEVAAILRAVLIPPHASDIILPSQMMKVVANNLA